MLTGAGDLFDYRVLASNVYTVIELHSSLLAEYFIYLCHGYGMAFRKAGLENTQDDFGDLVRERVRVQHSLGEEYTWRVWGSVDCLSCHFLSPRMSSIIASVMSFLIRVLPTAFTMASFDSFQPERYPYCSPSS